MNNKQSFSANNPIGFFDSGVGLLSVLAETKKLLPRENFVIFADQGHNPYGEKTKSQIIRYAQDATNFLIKKHKIKMMVLACNTATVFALESLREKFDIPIVGTVPAIKPAFGTSRDTRVAIMSTPATAKSKYLTSLIKDFGDNSRTLKVGCAGLEEAIEYGNEIEIKKTLDFYLAKVKKFKPDVIVLGCTHYPLIKNKIARVLPQVSIIDSSAAIARRIKDILTVTNSLPKKKIDDIYYTTGDPGNFARVASQLLQSKIETQRAYVA